MIRVCDLGAYLYCPRSVYLTLVLGVEGEPTAELDAARVGHMVRREMSLRQSRILSAIGSAAEAESAFAAELKSVIDEAPRIFSGQWRIGYAAHLPRIALEAAKENANLAGELDAMAEDMGLGDAVRHLTPARIGCPLASDHLRLKGVADKIMRYRELVPVDVKTWGPPASSFAEDRIQLCAHGMLLEEHSGSEVRYGLLEYVRQARRQPVPFTGSLREETLNSRDGVEAILGGAVPDVCPHGKPERCRRCSLSLACYRI